MDFCYYYAVGLCWGEGEGEGEGAGVKGGREGREREGEEGILVEFPSLACCIMYIMAQSYHPRDERDGEERVQRAIEHIPKADIIPSHLPELGALVRHEPQGHEIQHPLHDIQITVSVDRVDRCGVEDQVEQRKEYLHGVLVDRGAHPVGVEMRPVVRVGFAGPGDEVGRGGVVLDQPAAPEVGDAFLVAGRADDGEGVEVDGAFDCVGGFGRFLVDQDGVAF